MSTDIESEQEKKIIKRWESVRELFINKKATAENLGLRQYLFFSGHLFPKLKDCNMIYNSEIEESRCNNSYFQSIIDDVNNMDINNMEKPICEIKDLKDHIMWLKQYSDSDEVKIKDNSISIRPIHHDGRVSIYPVKKNNYHLFHGTTLENARKILEDGYIRPKKVLYLRDYNKVFFANTSKYAGLYGMGRSNFNVKPNWVETEDEINEYSIVFQINTSKYDVYHYCTYALDSEEYFIWGNVSVKDIEKIYLMKYYEIVREIEIL